MFNSCKRPEGKSATGKKVVLMHGLKHGFEQSPVNIVSTQTESGHHSITLYYKDEISEIENKGTTIQLDFKPGSSVVYEDTSFQFVQCHFHTPSEHLIDGHRFDMEMHIVNIEKQENPDVVPQYLVMAFLFKEGKRNKFIDDFLNAIPKEEHGVKKVKPGTVLISDMLDSIPHQLNQHFYFYKGSLTTPPYTETVRWFVAKRIFEASADQIQSIEKIEGHNARHVQAKHGRQVESK